MCYYNDTHFTREEIYTLEHDYVVNWSEEDRSEMYVASGFDHLKQPVITSAKEFKLYRWGLIPSWVKDWETALKLRNNTLNAMGETIDSKPSYRGAVKAGRFCVVPVKGFYEWHHGTNKLTYPHYIYPKTKPLFLFAGLYEQWTNQAINEVHNTFTIVTTPANKRMEWIHNTKKRMPLILSEEGSKIWLDDSVPFEEKKKLIVPYDEDLMSDHPIRRLITSRKENPNVPAVQEPVEYPELALM